MELFGYNLSNRDKLVVFSAVALSLGFVHGCGIIDGEDKVRPRSVQVKDFNGDGLADVLVISDKERKLFVGINDGFSYIPFEKDLESRAKTSSSEVKAYENKVRQAIDPLYKMEASK